MRTLVIEDDVVMAEAIRLSLEREGHNVVISDCGEDGVALARRDHFDIAILDLNLPDLPGEDVLAQLRADGIALPTLVLSGRDGMEARVHMLRHGADDYLAKPFDTRELVARLDAIVRRAQRTPATLLTIGGLTVDVDGQCARVGAVELPLTRKEFAVLELLALRRGVPVSKESFLMHLYDHMDVPGVKIIDVFICKLRRKLAETPGIGVEIDTIWGRGYQLREAELTAEVA